MIRAGLMIAGALCFVLGCDGAGDEVDGGAGGAGAAGAAGGAGASSSSGLGGGGSAGQCEVALQSDDDRLDSGLAQIYLDAHNAKRVAYCVEPLTWDCNLAAVAQAYAELGAWYLPHNPDRSEQYAALIGCTADCPAVGENIHWHSPWDFFPLDGCLQGWLDEEDEQACNDGGLHYLQMVTPQASAVGCGTWIDENEELHLVCNYLNDQGGDYQFPASSCSGCS